MFLKATKSVLVPESKREPEPSSVSHRLAERVKGGREADPLVGMKRLESDCIHFVGPYKKCPNKAVELASGESTYGRCQERGLPSGPSAKNPLGSFRKLLGGRKQMPKGCFAWGIVLRRPS